MPTSITLNDRLAERIAVLAAEAGQPVDAFVERVLQGLVDADIDQVRYRFSGGRHATVSNGKGCEADFTGRGGDGFALQSQLFLLLGLEQ